jgi:hypothetical protein
VSPTRTIVARLFCRHTRTGWLDRHTHRSRASSSLTYWPASRDAFFNESQLRRWKGENKGILASRMQGSSVCSLVERA